MLYIFFNSLSKSGSRQSKIYRIVAKSISIFQTEGVEIHDISKIADPNKLIKSLSETEDIVLIIGGDGTLTHIINKIHSIENLPKIYAYRAGTGNDFLRDLSKIPGTKIIKKRYFLINPYFKKLPTIVLNNSHERAFINGIGFGLDAYIANYVNTKKAKKGFASFFIETIRAFKNFRTYENCQIIIDGKEYNFEKVWLVSIMNGCYYGGGMKIAPNANRLSDQLSVIVIHEISKRVLPLLLTSVYTGRHLKYKKAVTELIGQNIYVKCDDIKLMQLDGESFAAKKEMQIYKK
ncbi:diacylglycerol/lipid kinase family protein [Metamycoplasma equirhinis]|uniref:diacylglycerol/lipid kinase family protein n=1 Tax=Metamycoplasma equirhinis TaxID=92402 RepID=UPI0035941D92